jgi:hypothetical protein
MPLHHSAVPAAAVHTASPPTDSWRYAALLWLHAWAHDATLLHIPKTGGMAIERVDAGAPVHWLGTVAAAGLRGMQNVAHNRFFGLQRMASGHITCRSSQNPTGLWHLTPRQLRACGIGAPVNPYERAHTYCVVREPISRFISNFYFGIWTWPALDIWPTACGVNPRRLMLKRPPPLEAMLQCFVAHTEARLALHRSQQGDSDAADDASAAGHLPNVGRSGVGAGRRLEEERRAPRGRKHAEAA